MVSLWASGLSLFSWILLNWSGYSLTVEADSEALSSEFISGRFTLACFYCYLHSERKNTVFALYSFFSTSRTLSGITEVASQLVLNRSDPEISCCCVKEGFMTRTLRLESTFSGCICILIKLVLLVECFILDMIMAASAETLRQSELGCKVCAKLMWGKSCVA